MRNDIIRTAEEANRLGIECWLSWQNRTDEIKLPVTPFWNLNKPKNNQVQNINEVGDVNLPGNRGLRTFDLESFFPHAGHNYAFCRDFTDDPFNACRMIDKWQASDMPIRVIFTNTTVNIAMLIENFQYGMPDRTRDIYFKLTLSEYIFLDAPVLSTEGATTHETAQPSEHATSAEWTLSYGDTLTGISLAKWGDADHVEDIIELNKSLITNPDSLKNIAGQVLKLE